MFGFVKAMHIKARILTGFAVVLAILIAVSVMAVRGFGTTRDQVEQYSQRVQVVDLVRQLDRDAGELRRYAREYGLTSQAADATKAGQIAGTIRDEIHQSFDVIKNPERLQRAHDLSDRFEEYMKNLLPRCLEWVETSAPCLAGPRHPPDGVSLFG
jgi:hypothetical protein